MYKEYLKTIIQNENLNKNQMSKMMMEIFSGNLTNAQIGAFMGALATKGETFEELAGAAMAMRRKAHRIEAMSSRIVDTCGTGGDNAKTFNISTTTAFVVAGCGVSVAKHGNRSISSQCGSADLLEALGVRINIDPEVVEESIADIGIGFLFAPVYHAAMRFAAGARKEIGLRTIFNMLGPLTNPAGANCQILGVFAPEYTEMFARTLQLLGSQHAFVVHGHDGLDEISVCAHSRVSELKDNRVSTYDIMPEQFFGRLADLKDLAGGTPKENAEITQNILHGQTGPRRDVILINASAALVAAGKAAHFQDGIQLAQDSIDSGNALAKLNDLIAFNRENG